MTGSGLGERYFISKLLLTTPGPAYEPTAHSLIGADLRQSTQVVCALRAPHCGHTAPVAKVSYTCWHCWQRQYSPTSGAVRQLGQAKPGRRGALLRHRGGRPL